MALGRLVFRVHAVKRMFERAVGVDEVRNVLEVGETIEAYPTNMPFPSRLVLGFSGARPLHVVAAYDSAADETYVITVYEPDPIEWEPGFRARRER